MSKYVYLNNKYVNYKDAKIHIEDRGFQFSDSVYEYKYINGNSWGNDEYVLGSCSAGNGNRTLETDTITQNLAPFYFNSCINSHLGCMDATAINYDSTALSDDGSCSYQVSVEFNVDMNNEVVSSSGVHIAGSFTSWSTDSIEMLDLDGDSIYTVLIDLKAKIAIGNSVHPKIIFLHLFLIK